MSKEIIEEGIKIYGIDPKRVLNTEYLESLGDFYKCNICFNVMVNPTDCELCGHSYCNDCISKLKCPFGCKSKNLKPSSMGIRNLLDKLIFKCLNEGCNEKIPYSNVRQHDQSCEFAKITCPSQNCGIQLPKKDMEYHIKNECKFSFVTCKYCGYEFPKNKINEHENICCNVYQSLNGESSVDLSKMDTNKYLEALSLNISKIVKDNKNKSFVGNEQITQENLESTLENIIQKKGINTSINNVSNGNEDNIIINNEDLKNSIKDGIKENLKTSLKDFEKNIGNLNESVSEVKNLFTQIQNKSENIINQNINKNDNNELNKEMIDKMSNYIKNLIDTTEKNIKNAINELNNEIISQLKTSNETINNQLNEKTNNIKYELKEIKTIKTESKIIEKSKDEKIEKEDKEDEKNLEIISNENFEQNFEKICLLINNTNDKIEGFKKAFTEEIRKFTEITTENIRNMIATTTLIEKGKENTIEDEEKKEIRKKEEKQMNERFLKKLQDNIQNIIEENSKQNYEKIKKIYEDKKEEENIERKKIKEEKKKRKKMKKKKMKKKNFQ